MNPEWLADYAQRVSGRTPVPIRITVTYSPWTDTVVLNAIRVPEMHRDMGHGEWALSELCRLADENGVRLALSPTGEWGANKAKLTAWYKRHGFRENRGACRDHEIRETMIREAL